jgi:hypothetical protein
MPSAVLEQFLTVQYSLRFSAVILVETPFLGPDWQAVISSIRESIGSKLWYFMD